MARDEGGSEESAKQRCKRQKRSEGKTCGARSDAQQIFCGSWPCVHVFIEERRGWCIHTKGAPVLLPGHGAKHSCGRFGALARVLVDSCCKPPPAVRQATAWLSQADAAICPERGMVALATAGAAAGGMVDPPAGLACHPRLRSVATSHRGFPYAVRHAPGPATLPCRCMRQGVPLAPPRPFTCQVRPAAARLRRGPRSAHSAARRWCC